MTTLPDAVAACGEWPLIRDLRQLDVELRRIRETESVRAEVARPCEYDAYQQHCRGRRVGGLDDSTETTEELLGRLDTIDTELIARIDTEYLLGQAPFWCKRALRILRGDHRTKLPEAPPDRIELNMLRRGTPSPVVRGRIIEAVDRLASIGLYIDVSDQWYAKEYPCGTFFVEKKAAPPEKPKLRTILDARIANAHMDSDKPEDDYHFPLIMLEDLQRLMSRVPQFCGPSESFYVINADLRHYYHQLPLCANLRPNFVVTTEGERGVRRRYVPKTLPMGWILAPYIAQCCTWSMLLRGDQPVSVEKHGISPDAYCSLERPPAWLTLSNGGFMCVLMDNILIVTPQRSHALAWNKRLERLTGGRDAGGFKVIFKPGTMGVQTVRKADQPAPGASVAASVASAPSSTVSGSTTPMLDESNSFEFLGVRWSYNMRQLIVDPTEEFAGLDTRSGVWAGSHRHLASIIGSLHWYHRVANSRMYHSTMQSFRALTSRVTPRRSQDWDVDVVLSPEEVHVIHAHLDERRKQRIFVNIPPRDVSALRSALAAVDASEQAYGVVIWHDTRENPYEWSSVGKMKSTYFKYIALNELVAIIMAAVKMSSLTPDAQLLVIATDSNTARLWVENRGARNKAANGLLQLLNERVLGDRELWLVYVPSASNAADPASRNSKLLWHENEHRLGETWALLDARHKTGVERGRGPPVS